MADLGYVEAQLGGVKDDGTKKSLSGIFKYLLTNWKFGIPENQVRLTNHQSYWLQSTTAASTAEFSVSHGLASAPHVALMALDLSQAGAMTPVLRVSRAADSKRIYLKAEAGSTNVPFTLVIE